MIEAYGIRSQGGAEPERELSDKTSVYYREDINEIVEISESYFFDTEVYVYIGEI